MADQKTGTVIYRQSLSQVLEIFRMLPEQGSDFPDYSAGQYIALSRDECKLTKKIVDENGQTKLIYDLDETGLPKRGRVTRSYSIASAPAETNQKGYLEFYVALEIVALETPGRLSESLFQLDPERDNKVNYVEKISGGFTLEKRADGFENVVMVGTGTGLAPFASMVKQLYYETLHGKKHGVRYTLFHANRTLEELGYHSELLAIEASRAFDFVYVPSVSRPIERDYDNGAVGVGRANNIVRMLFDMPMKEEQDAKEVYVKREDEERSSTVLARSVRPMLPRHFSKQQLLNRMDAQRTMILSCGNPKVMDDIKYIADANHVRFEIEDW